MENGSTDKEIITRVLKGDQRAYEVIVTRYQSFVFTIALRYTKNREDAEEVAQDTSGRRYRVPKKVEGKP